MGRELAARKDVTAVFAANDPFALGVITAVDDAGRNVPGDVSVVGLDDVKEAPFFRPALTTVKLDFEATGHVAVGRILAMIKEETEGDIPLLEPLLMTATPQRRPVAGADTNRARLHPYPGLNSRLWDPKGSCPISENQ